LPRIKIQPRKYSAGKKLLQYFHLPVSFTSAERKEDRAERQTNHHPPPLKETIKMLAIDFETYYGDKYSLTKMSTWDYLHHEKFDAYLVSAYNHDVKWAGHPKDMDWSLTDGVWLCAHNASFDELVYKRLQELGVIPASIKPKGFKCTADLTAYLRCMRNLKAASKYLLGREMSKEMRDYMQGRTWQDIVADGKEQEALDYVCSDAINCFDLWEKYGSTWPEVEQEYSRMNREACYRGVPINPDIDADIRHLETEAWKVAKRMPWIAEGKKPLSPIAIREQGQKDGIPVPASRAKTNEDAIKWYETYGESHPWVNAIKDHTSLNNHLKKVITLRDGTREDGTFPLQIKYFGTHTGRTAAGSTDRTGGKFNPLNFTREALFGVDLRGEVRAPKDKMIAILDYDQIEAIILLWKVGDQKMLDMAVEEGNLYQAYAKQNGWYPPNGKSLKKDDPVTYGRSKVSVLQLGYQSGWEKFQSVAKTNYGIIFSDDEAQGLVTTYRRNNPKIVRHWASHHMIAQLSCNHGDPTHEIALPSGRDLVYFNPKWQTVTRKGKKTREMVMRPRMGDRHEKVYGGKLTENEIQAIARDVLRDGRVAVEKAGHNVMWDVYDELICLVPKKDAEEHAKEIQRLMVSSSPWIENCPLGAGYDLFDRYTKA
jgi:DNA polymerase I-like protein with 3'-5' exonuclease and polymerase domains